MTSRAEHIVELTDEELEEFVVGGPTSDDVSFTYDGRRLDTKEKVLAFLAELDAEGIAPPRAGVD